MTNDIKEVEIGDTTYKIVLRHRAMSYLDIVMPLIPEDITQEQIKAKEEEIRQKQISGDLDSVDVEKNLKTMRMGLQLMTEILDLKNEVVKRSVVSPIITDETLSLMTEKDFKALWKEIRTLYNELSKN